MGLGVHTVLYHLYRRYNKVIFHPLNRQKNPSKSDPNQIVQSANGEWGWGGSEAPNFTFEYSLFLLLPLPSPSAPSFLSLLHIFLIPRILIIPLSIFSPSFPYVFPPSPSPFHTHCKVDCNFTDLILKLHRPRY